MIVKSGAEADMEVPATDLIWLVEPPEDFRQQVHNLLASTPNSEAVARRLSSYRLGVGQLHTLGTAVQTITAKQDDAVRLGVVSNGTFDLILPALTVSALRRGVWLQVKSTGFDQVATEALDPNSSINRAQCHLVLLAVDHRGLPLTACPGDRSRAHESVSTAVEYLNALREALRSASGCTVIVQTVPQIPNGLFGSLERNLVGTMQWLIDRYNLKLRKAIQHSSDLLFDAASLAETIGVGRWHDPGHWTLGRFPFSLDAIPLYADWLGRLIAAIRGKSRKCLVLDLDNTLWGGVIGDDGLPGIILGNGSPAGESFLEIQRTALALRERGVILAVSSKNDDPVARSPFKSHPDMVLKEEHIAVFQANWQDKASNLKAIADTLNIGVDALVLLDDNPAERAQVRETLPMMAVPELPSDPVHYASTLLAAGYFEAISFTSEDRQRANQYSANAKRAQLLGAATDLTAYLRSLDMIAICVPFDRIGRARITQLINKSNQFNLTTRRYTEREIEVLEKCSLGLTLQIRLIDKFGDNGIVAVVICRDAAPDWVIETWLMSCRVLNRKLEQATLNHLTSRARREGVRRLIGEYIPSERNGIVKDHYTRLGFAPLSLSGATSRWWLDVLSYVPTAVPVEIIEATTQETSGEERLCSFSDFRTNG